MESFDGIFDPVVSSIAVALGAGLLVGVERERRKGEGPERSAAGVRTFAITALLAVLAALSESTLLLGFSAFGVIALTVVSYLRSRSDDPGLTTEVALIATFVIGALAASRPMIAAAAGVLLALLLYARESLGGFAREKLSEQELLDALLLAAAALVVLPILPDEPIDPWNAINLQLVWRVTVLIMLVNAAGYVAQRLVGARFGLPISGLVGGFVSSSAVIAAMAGRAKQQPETLRAAVAGAALSSIATVMQLVLILWVANPALLVAMWLPLAAMALASVAASLWFTWRSATKQVEVSALPGRAFNLRMALVFAGVFCALGILVVALQKAFGAGGALAAAVVGGFLDAHSTSASIAGLAARELVAPTLAIQGIGLVITTNIATKLALARVGGGAFFRRLAPSLLIIAGGWWLGWWLTSSSG
jgi:uncharacterized membrane protein (DUF4010 family)